MQGMDLVRMLVCLAPIALLFCAITFARAKVSTAAGLGLAAALVSAFALGSLTADAVYTGVSSGVVSALSILYAIWPAIFLCDIMRQSGAFDVLRRVAVGAVQDSLILVLLFGWIFSSFLQSITGFGVPVAICAPFLVALGVRPIPAVVMTLIGHAWGNTYGTLGMAWDSLVQMGPVDSVVPTALLASLMLWLVNASAGAIICCIYGGRRALGHGIPFVLLMSAVMGGGQLLVSCFNQTIAAFIPTVVALVVSFLLFKARVYTKPWSCPSHVVDEARVSSAEASSQTGEAPIEAGAAMRCISPFVFLAALSLVVFVVPPVKNLLSAAALAGVTPFAHAGFVLTLTCVFALVAMRERLSHADLAKVRTSALGKLWGVSASILLLVIMARLLQTTGQMQLLASGVASMTGQLYVPLAPALGTFGAFVTSSNMSSNILLAGFQHAMADKLGISPVFLLAAQTAGGAAGAAIGPSTILMGATTAGAQGKEGEILKPLLAVSFSQAIVLGVFIGAVVLWS